MCCAGGKRFSNWLKLQSAQTYIAKMEKAMDQPLIEEGKGSNDTWIHPLLAHGLAEWLSPPPSLFIAEIDTLVTALADESEEQELKNVDEDDFMNFMKMMLGTSKVKINLGGKDVEFEIPKGTEDMMKSILCEEYNRQQAVSEVKY